MAAVSLDFVCCSEEHQLNQKVDIYKLSYELISEEAGEFGMKEITNFDDSFRPSTAILNAI